MKKITTEECDAMLAGVINNAHCIEKFMRVVYEYYVQQCMETKECKAENNRMYTENLIAGMPSTIAIRDAERRAEMRVRKSTKESVDKFCPLPYISLMDKIKEVIDMIDTFTEVGIECNKLSDESNAKVYDYIQTDADRMCRLFCRFSNIDSKDDQAEEAVMRYEERGLLSEEFINRWFRTNV